MKAGIVPLSIAVQIACASTADAQKALSEAYDKAISAGSKFRTV
jgi:hypothetical protein